MNYEIFARIGIRNKTIPIPFMMIKRMVSAEANKLNNKNRRFSKEKNVVHHFIVRELPNIGKPMSLIFIAQALDMPLASVQSIVEELEKEKTFIYRYNSNGINWAYPVTVDKTPHHITFSTGEQVNAA